MSKNANPFKPKNQKRTLMLSVTVGFVAAIVIAIAGVALGMNGFLTLFAVIAGGFTASAMAWKRF